MNGELLVTGTLLDGFEFAVNAPPTWKDRAVSGFISKLRREKVEYPSWVKAGQNFEDTVHRVCTTKGTRANALSVGSDMFAEVVNECYGGAWQQKLSKKLVIGEYTAFCFGYTDVEMVDRTIDLKTCIEWKGQQKYLNKNQHKLYLWMNGKPLFTYIVVELKDRRIQSVNNIDYMNPGADALEKDIRGRTEAMWDYIQAEGLWHDYYYTFSKNK